MRSGALLLRGSLAGLLVACAGDENPFSASALYPLAPGRYWVYQHSETDPLSHQVTVTTDTQRVLDDTVINGTTWYRMSRSETLGLNAGREYFTNRPDGLWALTLDSDTVSFLPQNLERLYFRYPARTGDSYEVDPWQFTYPFTVTSTDDHCPSLDGTRCIRYDDRSSFRTEAVFHIAPGVGLVQLDYPGRTSLDSLGHLVVGSAQFRLVATGKL